MKALKNIDLENVVFFDIETVRIEDKLEKDTDLYRSWEYKMRYSREAESKMEATSLEESYNNKAALYAEFAKVVCITIGKIKDGQLMLKSFYGEEGDMLRSFADVLNGMNAKNKYLQLAGHAIIGFDIPFLMRRCLINGVEVPNLLDTSMSKPWEVTAIDTMNIWKATSFYGASLLNIATAFGLPSPKMDVAGYETSDVYWKEGEKGLKRIVEYCERDVLTVANIVRKCRFEKIVEAVPQEFKAEKTGILTKIYNTKTATDSDKQHVERLLADMKEVDKIKAGEILSVVIPKEPKTVKSLNTRTK